MPITIVLSCLVFCQSADYVLLKKSYNFGNRLSTDLVHTIFLCNVLRTKNNVFISYIFKMDAVYNVLRQISLKPLTS